MDKRGTPPPPPPTIALRAKHDPYRPSIAPRADARLCARTGLPLCALAPLRAELRRAAIERYAQRTIR